MNSESCHTRRLTVSADSELGHPHQSSLCPFPHKRGRKLWGLPLVTHGGSDPCQIQVWESFSEIIVVWHSHPFSSSSSVLAIGVSLIENLRPCSCSSVLVVHPLPWSLSSSRLSSSLRFLSLGSSSWCHFVLPPGGSGCRSLSVLSLDLDSPHCALILCLELQCQSFHCLYDFRRLGCEGGLIIVVTNSTFKIRPALKKFDLRGK
jgi:hypothetical protein